MSRQEIGRAMLQTLSSHEEDERLQYSSQADTFQTSHPNNHHPYQHQHSNAPSIGKSYFGGNALQITDSPTTSPVLSAMTFDRYEGRPRSIMQRRRGRFVGDGEGASTPGTNDVPSLSLSNSSFSDGPLRSPFTEQAPSQTSVSSTRTLMQHPRSATMVVDSEKYPPSMSESALHRVASHLRMPVEDIRRVQRCMSLNGEFLGNHQDQIIHDLGRDTFDKIALAFRYEEERLPSFRSSYLRTDSLHSEADLQHSRTAYAPYRSSSRYTPLSPTASTHDELDFLDRSGPIPSPRAALEMLAAGSNLQHNQTLSPHSPSASFDPYSTRPYPAYRQGHHALRSPYDRHSRYEANGNRPNPLPDRSYHSMDDYTPRHGLAITSPLIRGENILGVRDSLHNLVSSPVQRISLSRQTSRSPFIESPTLMEDDIMGTEGSAEGARQSSLHLRPVAFSSRHQSASNHLLDGADANKKASRRASAEVLSRSVKRAASPLYPHREDFSYTSNEKDVSGLPLEISHEEVMARLKRKVKERLAARGALDISSSNVLIGGRPSKGTKTTRSPSISKRSSLPYGASPGSLGRGAAKRLHEGSPDAITMPTRGSGSVLGRPHKPNSLRSKSREIGSGSYVKREDANMEEDVYYYSGTAGMGIEALLSAAAIADNPHS